MTTTVRRAIFLVGAAAILCAYMGWLPSIDGSHVGIEPAATAPPKLERDEAWLLVFFSVFLVPIAGLVGFFFLRFIVEMVSGVIKPAVGALHLPEKTTKISAVVVLLLAAYLARAFWLPTSVWAVNTLLRACQIVFA